MDKLENQEELNHSTLKPSLLCIDVYKIRNKVDCSFMVSEFVAYQNDLIQIMCAQFTCTNCALRFVYTKQTHLIK